MRRRRTKAEGTTNDELTKVIADVRRTREAKLGKLAAQENELATKLGINVQDELRKRHYSEAPTKEVDLSTLASEKLGFFIGLPRIDWRLHQSEKYPSSRDNSSFREREVLEKQQIGNYLNKLPGGTQLHVVASYGHEETVRYRDGSQQTLRWPMEPQGMLWLRGEREGKASFAVDQSLKLSFTDTNELILSDPEKSITLTYSQVEPGSYWQEVDNHFVVLELPKQFEQTYQVEAGSYLYGR